MKRIVLSCMFFVVGLFTTWGAMFAGSNIPTRLKINVAHFGFKGCYEIGPCSVPWWETTLLALYVLGPSVGFAMTGWVSARTETSIAQKIRRLLTMIIITALLYLVAYAASR